MYDLPRPISLFNLSRIKTTHRSRSAGPCMSLRIIRSRYVVHPSFNQKWFQLAQPIRLPVQLWL